MLTHKHDTMDANIAAAYSQSGGDLPFFIGKQYGAGGWLRTIARFAFPLIKRALGVAVNTADDMIKNKRSKLGPTVKRHAMKELKGFMSGNGVATSINRGRKRQKVMTILDRNDDGLRKK